LEVKEIKMAQMAVGEKDGQIKTGSIGSCVVIVLYDKTSKKGGMAHAMLPSRGDKEKTDVEAPAKYADDSIDRLLEKLEQMGSAKANIHAKLVGGARMFKILSGDRKGIGESNLNAARGHLEELGIPVDSEDTGGTTGKTAILNLSTGIVDVESRM